MKYLVSIAMLAAMLALTGCADPKEVQILSDRNDELTRKLIGLDGELLQAESSAKILRSANEKLLSDLAGDRTQIGRLEKQLADAIEDLRKERLKSGALPAGPSTGTATRPAADDPKSMTLAFTLAGDVAFDPGSATLKNAAKAELDKAAATLAQKHPGGLVAVCGHTDSDPIVKSKWKNNQALSEVRAAAVAKYLIDKGVAIGRIRVYGYGALWPVGPEHTPAQKAANRRVEIRVAQ